MRIIDIIDFFICQENIGNEVEAAGPDHSHDERIAQGRRRALQQNPLQRQAKNAEYDTGCKKQAKNPVNQPDDGLTGFAFFLHSEKTFL